MNKKYTAKSLTGATRRVRNCEKIIATYEGLCQKLKAERLLMAKLAADTPQFDNPLVVYDAKKLRDEILARRGR